MDDGAMLLRAVLDDPGADTPRLVYADWLDDTGRREDADRAAFIRAQCRLHRMPEDEASGGVPCERCRKATGFYLYPPRCRGEVCRLRMREYYAGRRYTVWDWCRGLPAGCAPVYRRGFVEEWAGTGDEWVAFADAATAAHPLRVVTLVTVPTYSFDGDGRTRLDGRSRSHWVPRGEGFEHTRAGIAAWLLSEEWPRVEFRFDLAPPPRQYQLTVNGVPAGTVTF